MPSRPGRPSPSRSPESIPADALFNIEHEREGGVEELEFQLRWKRDGSSK
jgi:hypothetical protein